VPKSAQSDSIRWRPASSVSNSDVRQSGVRIPVSVSCRSRRRPSGDPSSEPSTALSKWSITMTAGSMFNPVASSRTSSPRLPPDLLRELDCLGRVSVVTGTRSQILMAATSMMRPTAAPSVLHLPAHWPWPSSGPPSGQGCSAPRPDHRSPREHRPPAARGTDRKPKTWKGRETSGLVATSYGHGASRHRQSATRIRAQAGPRIEAKRLRHDRCTGHGLTRLPTRHRPSTAPRRSPRLGGAVPLGWCDARHCR